MGTERRAGRPRLKDHPATSPALEDWYRQEASSLPPVEPSDADEDRLPSGWWIVPGLVLSSVLWALILSALF